MSIETDAKKTPIASWGPVVIAWIFVSLPLAWGVWMTARKAALLFLPPASANDQKHTNHRRVPLTVETTRARL